MTEKRKLEKYCGDVSQIYDLRHCILQDGRSKGTHAILADNGSGLELMLLPDKCLGIPKLKYGGLNIGFMCKNGISAPEFYQEEGTRGFLRNFEAGFLTTCGLTYFGSPCEVDGQRYGLHGAIANTPIGKRLYQCRVERRSGLFKNFRGCKGRLSVWPKPAIA